MSYRRRAEDHLANAASRRDLLNKGEAGENFYHREVLLEHIRQDLMFAQVYATLAAMK